jgi:BolA protein
MGPVAAAIKAKLAAALHPSRLDLEDESARHAGHAHAGIESHFRLVIESAAFSGLSRVERQRRVLAVLAEELAGPVHALSISALAPAES